MLVSPMKEALLRGLGNYKYLTVSHVIALSISKSKKKSADYFRELRNRGFTNRIAHVAVPNKDLRVGVSKRVRHEDLHYLTAKGAKFLDTNTELSLPDIRYPKKQRSTLSNDYIHRVSTIFMHISFDRWVTENGYSKAGFRVYYDNKKDQRNRRQKQEQSFKSETRIDFKDGRHYSPDVIFTYENREEKPFLFCLEVYNGNRTTYVVEQLKKLLWIIENTRRVSRMMKVDRTPRILCTCDNERLLTNVISAVKEDETFLIEHIEQLLFFNFDNNVWKDFGANWVNIEGEVMDLKQG